MNRLKKNSSAPASPEPPAPATRRSRRTWVALGSILVIAALAFGGTAAWRRHVWVGQASAGLPARPDLAGRPAILGELLDAAGKQVRLPDTMIAGLTQLGRVYHANGFRAEAEACWQRLRREQPHEARWSYYLADLRRAASDHPAMAGLLEETLRDAPQYTPARLQLANLLFKSGEFAEAARHYQARLEALPQDPYARLGLVRLAQQSGRSGEAKALLESMLKDTPHFSTGHNLYAELLAAEGDEAGAARHRWLGRETLRYREAEDPWLDELQAWCYDYDRLCVLGTIESQTEQPGRAQAYFERALRLEPGRPEAYDLLAVLYLKRNDAEGARALLEPALPRLDAAKAPAIFATLGLAYRTLQQPADAIRVVQQGLAQTGRPPELLHALGLALAQSGRHEEAVAAWQEALSRNPGDASVNYHLATSFLALRRLDDALAALDRSLTLQPTFLPTLLLRGEIELEAGHLKVAENHLRRAFDSHPEDANARRLLAAWHLRIGAAAEAASDARTAQQHYRDGLALDANHAGLLVAFGRFHLMQRRPAEALPLLTVYHQLQPENASGCLFLGNAYAATGRRDDARAILTKGLQLAEQSGQAEIAQHCRRLLRQL